MIISLNKFKATGGTKVEGNLDITENGVYDVSGFATITINTDASQGVNYSNFTGGVDVEGLRAIGWDDESICYFRDNFNIYSWQAPYYMVTEENKALYGVVNSDTDMSAVEGMKYCPMIDTSNVLDMFRMFDGCSSLVSIPQLDTSNVTNIASMFRGCSSLASIPQLNTSNVTGMDSLFNGCSSLTSIPQLDTSKVTNIVSLFDGCSSLVSIPQLDTSKVTNIASLFYGCSSLTSIPQLDTSNVTSMESMFYGCSSLTSIPQLDTSKVTTMYTMFKDCSSLTSIPQLDTSNVTSIGTMFNGCSKLERVEGIDFSSLSSSPSALFGYSKINSLTHFIVNGVINFTWTSYGLDYAPNLDFDSIKSILVAMSKTTNTNAKTMKFKSTISDQNGELTALISTCSGLGWTITGLTIN